MALLVDDHHPVGIAVERDADVGAYLVDLVDQRRRGGRADVAVDVEAVRLDADGEDLGAQLPQRLGRHLVGGAIGAIDDDAQAVERQVARQRALGELDIAVLDAVDALGAAEIGRAGEPLVEVGFDQRLDLVFDLIRQLLAVGAEQLDAVVVVGIVRGGDHHPEIAAHGVRQHGDAGRRHRAGQENVHADRQEAGGKRVLDHVAGQARVLADDHPVAVVAAMEHQSGSHADLQGELRRDRLVRAPANAVSPEMLACHVENHSPARSSGRLLIAP